jgi:hypothetical protein
MAMEVLNCRVIIDCFNKLAELKDADSEAQESLCRFWGDVGLRWLCTPNENKREIGIGLLKVVHDWRKEKGAKDEERKGAVA